ncbi:MAG: hypothetical protein ACD_20C00413G0017 [uncultured bacterium]|nr:MAG: hypothetical protein ACD_20C00413G0017 [uncultured bacterium]
MINHNISFFIPAYNCEATLAESVDSIMKSNFEDGDELIIVNDGSTDNTAKVLQILKEKYPVIKIIDHIENKGGGAARNTAIKNAKNEILFCLDSDNILENDSIYKLKRYLIENNADVATFQYVHYFKENINEIIYKWQFKPMVISLADFFAGHISPPSSGNYMFTKKSWEKAGGYPEFTWLDAWGFGFRQLATGSKMLVLSNTYYYHRFGHESYYIRGSKSSNISLVAAEIIEPYKDLLSEKSCNYIFGKGKNKWLEECKKKPVKVKSGEKGKTGKEIPDPNNIRSYFARIPFIKRLYCLSKTILFNTKH